MKINYSKDDADGSGNATATGTGGTKQAPAKQSPKFDWEPFWLFEYRMAASRLLIGRTYILGVAAVITLIGLIIITTSFVNIGVVHIYSYSMAVLGVDSVAGARSAVEQTPVAKVQTPVTAAPVSRPDEPLSFPKMVRKEWNKPEHGNYNTISAVHVPSFMDDPGWNIPKPPTKFKPGAFRPEKPEKGRPGKPGKGRPEKPEKEPELSTTPRSKKLAAEILAGLDMEKKIDRQKENAKADEKASQAATSSQENESQEAATAEFAAEAEVPGTETEADLAGSSTLTEDEPLPEPSAPLPKKSKAATKPPSGTSFVPDAAPPLELNGGKPFDPAKPWEAEGTEVFRWEAPPDRVREILENQKRILANLPPPVPYPDKNSAGKRELDKAIGEAVAEMHASMPHPAHARTTSTMFQIQQEVCPGKTTIKSMKQGVPKPSALADIKKHLDLLADRLSWTPGEGGNPDTYNNVSCVFVTKECSQNRSTVQGRWVYGKLALSSDQELAEVAELLPDIPEGGLGSCAIVGNSDNMIGMGRGAEIDAHDTIFRHNTPLKGYEKDVGRRRSVVFMKSKYQGKSDELSDVELALAELKDIAEVPRGMRSQGKMIFLRSSAANHFARLRRKMYALNAFGARKHPSGGFARPMNLLASKLCRRIDLYGFSADMGGKYFKRSEKVRPAHVMSFEHWTYRYLQKQGKMCVYGD